LPFHEISDEEFGDRFFYRTKVSIDAFTERARAAGEFEDQLLGSETRAGFRLVDLLSRRYDVVAANPPYMGSKSMGLTLKKHVERKFKTGKRDLYASFILRNYHLTVPGGRVAMVTQQSWMFLGSFAELRAIDGEKLATLSQCDFRGLLYESTLETVAHLGENGFDDSSAAGAFVAMFTFAVAPPSADHRLTAFRLIGPKSTEEKDRLLRHTVCDKTCAIRSTPKQKRFLDIPQSPLSYWLRERFFDLLSGPCLGAIIVSKEGITTTDNDRFIRFVHESPIRSAWRPVPKGGGYCKWFGLNFWSIDWRDSGSRLFSIGKATMRNLDYWGREGYTYTQLARGGLGTRLLLPGTALEHKGPAIFVHNGSEGPLDLLNSRTVSFLLRVMNQGMEFRSSTIERVPTSTFCGSSLRLASCCVQLKRLLVGLNPIEASFNPNSYRASFRDVGLRASAYLHSFEGGIEKQIVSNYSLDETDVKSVTDETGTPAGWFPLIEGYDDLTGLDAAGLVPDGATLAQLQELLPTTVEFVKRCSLNTAGLDQLRQRVKLQYESGLGGTGDEHSQDADVTYEADDDESTAIGARIAIPSETILEELSQRAELHPISIYWLLKEGIERHGWRCPAEERQHWANGITVTLLRMLGHRWPKQVEAGDEVPDWADPDGIIPLTSVANESTLFERVQQRLRADEIVTNDFAEVMGKPLNAWLATEFFKHHTKQFKKRPIAWQLQSGKFTIRNPPAFACLLYYHKLDADTLPKLRSQYVGPLRQRLETELRGILAVAAEARSDRQEKRRAELDDAIHELTAFDAKLEQVARDGFATAGLKKLLESETLDRWCSLDGKRPHPTTTADVIAQESAYAPDINDGVRVNIAPLQKAGLLAADVLAKKDVDKAIADRAQWRVDERRWVREGKLPQPGWWPENGDRR